MKTNKQIISIITALGLLLAMSSCSSTNEDADTNEKASTSTSESSEEPVNTTTTNTKYDFKGSAPDIISVDEENVDYMEGRIASLTYTVHGPISSHIFQDDINGFKSYGINGDTTMVDASYADPIDFDDEDEIRYQVKSFRQSNMLADRTEVEMNTTTIVGKRAIELYAYEKSNNTSHSYLMIEDEEGLYTFEFVNYEDDGTELRDYVETFKAGIKNYNEE